MNDKTDIALPEINEVEKPQQIEPSRDSKKAIQVSQGFSVAPQNLGELMTFANMLASSDLVPKDYKGKPGNVMVAMQMGHEIGIAPMQAIQNIAVINGKPSIYGDLGKALLRARGCDIEEADTEEIRKTGVAWCVIKRQGQQPVKRTFSVEDAKTAKLWMKEGPWTTYPFRQMGWRAFWFAARDAAPDILKGIMGREEIEDYEGEILKEEAPREDLMPKRASETKVEPIPDNSGPPPASSETVKSFSEMKKSEAPAETKPTIITPEQRSYLKKLAFENKLSIEEVDRHISAMFGVIGVEFLLSKDVERVAQWIRTQKPGK